jgi:hypothetical protein
MRFMEGEFARREGQQPPTFGGIGAAISNGMSGVGQAINSAISGVPVQSSVGTAPPGQASGRVAAVVDERTGPPRPNLNPFGFWGEAAEKNRMLLDQWEGQKALVEQLVSRGVPRERAIQAINNNAAMKLALEDAGEQRNAESNRRLAEVGIPSQQGGAAPAPQGGATQAPQGGVAPAPQGGAPAPTVAPTRDMTAAQPENQSRLNQLLQRRANTINMALRDPRISKSSIDLTVGQIDKEIANIANTESNKRFSLQPIYGVDAQGNPIVLQLGQDGRAAQSAMPDNVRIQRDPIRIDAGTETVLLDPITRQRIGSVPKNIAGAAAQREIGENIGSNAAAAGQAITTAQTALQTIDKLMNHPGRGWGTGLASKLPVIPGTEQAGFIKLFDQVKSQSFLTAFETLKGGGAITEAEGKAATSAINRLDRATNQKDFDDAAADVRIILQSAIKKANADRSRLDQLPGSAPIPGGAPNRAAISEEAARAEARRRGLVQ